MRLAAIAVLAVALAACGKKAPAPPTPEAVGAELATFPQILVLISSTTWAGMQAAVARNDMDRADARRYPQPYAHGVVTLDGKETPVLVAYTGVWQAPSQVPLQTMSVQQYLRAFGADEGVNLASVIAPKGAIFFTRDQLPDVLAAARNAGAPAADLPYGVVRGVGR